MYFILNRVLGAPDRGRDEKLAWECTLTAQVIDCSVALQKFGLRVYVASDQAEDEEHAAAIAKDLISRVRRSVGVVEAHILRGIAKERVASGNLTIDNQHRWFREMYEHFRRRAEQGFKDAETMENQPPEKIVSSDGHDGWLHFNRRFELRRQAEFDAVAALSAYFSMIEHLLVIAVAFTSFDPEKQSLERFIGDRWSDKFKCVVQLDGHPTAQRSYNILHRIAEELRNPQAHGGFDHQKSRFHFHLPGVGAVPARLTRGGRGTTYTFDSESDQGQRRFGPTLISWTPGFRMARCGSLGGTPNPDSTCRSTRTVVNGFTVWLPTETRSSTGMSRGCSSGRTAP